ncbi:MAG: alpha-glucan family phosphorylase [Dehalococcoidia bacterium]|nr:alpha-glucan family phosphorylase [Dehalococcoidia bacterium]
MPLLQRQEGRRSRLIQSKLPERIGRLDELAHNLWWSWHPLAREMYRALDYPMWRANGHNPVRQLHRISPERLEAVAADSRFLSLYDEIMAEFDADMNPASHTWYGNHYPRFESDPIAYFSMELAIHNSLPIYAGGLGVLAGDLCKEACDLGLPLVAVGFMYPQGYFHQHISPEGEQEEVYRQLDFKAAPVSPLTLSHESRQLAKVRLNDRILHLRVWQVRLGRVTVFLLDTNTEENAPQDRDLSARLYTADREQRIQQEMLLGIGGVRVLKAVGVKPSIWHANEGHTAFMMVERIRQEMEENHTPFPEAVEKVRQTTIFTTHTPVAAGHDIFTTELVEKYFRDYWPLLSIDRETFFDLGQHCDPKSDGFNMTVLALKMSGQRNAVSKLHAGITRKMWHALWPCLSEDEVPISHITNGVHGATWLAPEMSALYVKYLSGDLRDLVDRQDDPALWKRIFEIPDEEIWAAHQLLKRKLASTMLERVQARWAEDGTTAEQILAMGVLLHPEVLTLAFVRRFTEYKRPTLIFHDVERLKRIIDAPLRPVQIIFAGKSHPADLASKDLLQQAYMLAKDHDFRGRIAFVEDYDMHMAHYLVQGVDVWLNTPRRGKEASGTSGMKASLNGVLQLSVPDGWWYEGFNGGNGWVIGDGPESAGSPDEDERDAMALYDLLENKIVPLYYERDRIGVPHRWVHTMKETIRSVAPAFCARRMMKEYVEQMYVPALESAANRSKG